MELIGHRGCGVQSEYPDNTVPAVQAAAAHLPAIEVDVRRCGSGEVVVHHDEVIEGPNGETVFIEGTTYEELAEIPLGPTGEDVPQLADVLEVVPSDVTAQIELKETGLAEDVRDAIDASAASARISSFSERAIREFAALETDVPLGYLFGEAPARNVETAVELGCTYAHPHHSLCLKTDVISIARERDLGVIAWNTDDPEVVAALDSVDVDGLTVDRWDLAASST